MNFQRLDTVVLSITTVFIIVISGCASGPTIRTNFNKSTDFSAYTTFGFVSELGTDRAGYSTIITKNFKDAVRTELESRGYAYTETDPDLLVNFYTNVRSEASVQNIHMPTIGTGYYDYRTGLYTAPTFNDQVYVDHYRIGTANIDIVDAKRKQLIWGGVAEGMLTNEVMNDISTAIHRVVARMFVNYPAVAGAAAMDNSTK